MLCLSSFVGWNPVNRPAVRSHGYVGCFMEPNGAEVPSRNSAMPPVHLSEPEKRLARLVACGLTDDEIAVQLELSRSSVDEHIKRLLARIGARDRLEILFHVYSDPTLLEQIGTATENHSLGIVPGADPRTNRKAS